MDSGPHITIDYIRYLQSLAYVSNTKVVTNWAFGLIILDKHKPAQKAGVHFGVESFRLLYKRLIHKPQVGFFSRATNSKAPLPVFAQSRRLFRKSQPALQLYLTFSRSRSVFLVSLQFSWYQFASKFDVGMLLLRSLSSIQLLSPCEM